LCQPGNHHWHNITIIKNQVRPRNAAVSNENFTKLKFKTYIENSTGEDGVSEIINSDTVIVGGGIAGLYETIEMGGFLAEYGPMRFEKMA
jgi:hypothetical protein